MLASHVNPEADAIGSIMAIGMALESMGKKPYMYNVSGVPNNLMEFALVDRVSSELPTWKPDVLAVLDCGDLDRIGPEAVKAFRDVETIVNIDHHSTNDMFGHINWVVTDVSSTGEMIVDLIEETGASWSPDMADWVLAAIVADTGGFRFSNTTAKTYLTAAKMVERGASPATVSRRIFGNIPEGTVKLLGMALSTLDIRRDMKLATMEVTMEMFAKTGAGPDAVEGFIEHPRSLSGIEVAAVFRQVDEDKYKVSLRSNGYVDVGAVAYSFGGGGHRQAAGFSIDGKLENVKAKLREAIVDIGDAS